MVLPLDAELKIVERTGRQVMDLLAEFSRGEVLALEVWVSPDPTIIRQEQAGERPAATREVRYHSLRPESQVRLLDLFAQTLTERFGWRETDHARTEVAQAHARAEHWRTLARRVVACLYLNRAELPAGSYLERAAPRFLADAAVDDAHLGRRMHNLEGEIAEFQATHSRLHRHGFRILEQVGHAINALTRTRQDYTWDERKDSALLHLAAARRYLLEPSDTQPSDAPGAIRTPDDPYRGERAAYRRLDGVLREQLGVAQRALHDKRDANSRVALHALSVVSENLDEALLDLARGAQ